VMRTKETVPLDPVAAATNPIYGRILGAAFNAFAENGYAGTSTLEIATRARVSKRDLYANFGSKQAMLVACITSRAARMRLPPDLPVPRSLEMLASTLTTFGTTVLREVCDPAVMVIFRLAISEAEHSPEVAEALNASRLANRSAIVGLLARAQAAGTLGRGDPQRMMEQFFALLWGDLMLGLLLRVVAAPNPAEIDRRARAATEAFLKLYASGTANSR
jgi:AcrR family transcriptional regulator